MVGFRKLLSILFLLTGLGALGMGAAGFTIRAVGEAAYVSQVFKRIKTLPLGPGHRLGWYDAAVTPSAPGKIAVLCRIIALSDDGSLNLIEKKVWLVHFEPVPYAFHENDQARNFLILLLGTGLLLGFLAVPLYPPK